MSHEGTCTSHYMTVSHRIFICKTAFVGNPRNFSHVSVSAVRKKPNRRYACTTCALKFRWSAHLQKHMQNHHNRQPPGRYRCDHCDFSTHFAGPLANHKKFVHRSKSAKQPAAGTDTTGTDTRNMNLPNLANHIRVHCMHFICTVKLKISGARSNVSSF